MLTVIAVAGWAAAFVLAAVAWRQHRAEAERSTARVMALAAAIEGGGANELAGFGTENTLAPPPGRRDGSRLTLAVTAAAPIVMLVAGLLVYRSPETLRTSAASDPPNGLELLAMRPTRTGDDLVVTGRVRVHGDRAATITAVATALDAAGHVVGRARAAVDDARLDVEGESSFEVVVRAAGDVARYQVRFETPLGPLAHLDRRAAATNDDSR